MCEASAKARSEEASGRAGGMQAHQGTRRMGTETGDQSRHLESQVKSTHHIFEEINLYYYDAFKNVSKSVFYTY